MNEYNKFATVYDQMGHDSFSVKMVIYTLQIMRRYRIEASQGLDLCCGTGTALRMFADKGFKMVGLDQSTAMLKQAREKIRGQRVQLYKQSLPQFLIPQGKNSRRARRFDLVTSFFDSLNYMKNERELKAAFRSVYRHLVPGGWFIFDMNTPEALKVLWGSSTWGDAQEALAWIWKNEYNGEKLSAECTATFFVRSGGYWKRFDEVHIERAYSNRVLRRLLREVGFDVRGLFRCLTFERPTRDTLRVCVVARRPG